MAAKPFGPDYRMSCRASLPSGDHDDSLENFHPAATSLSAVRALAVALRRAMPQACMRGGGCVSFQSVLALKKIKREAAAQRRPAQSERKNRVFFRETTGRMVWNAQRFKLKML